MDPTANLKEQLALSDEIRSLMDKPFDLVTDEQDRAELEEKAERFAELVSDLHHWISRGGALPDQWRRPVDPDEGLLDDLGEQLN